MVYYNILGIFIIRGVGGLSLGGGDYELCPLRVKRFGPCRRFSGPCSCLLVGIRALNQALALNRSGGSALMVKEIFGGFHKFRGDFYGVSIIRVILFWRHIWGPTTHGNYPSSSAHYVPSGILHASAAERRHGWAQLPF